MTASPPGGVQVERPATREGFQRDGPAMAGRVRHDTDAIPHPRVKGVRISCDDRNEKRGGQPPRSAPPACG